MFGRKSALKQVQNTCFLKKTPEMHKKIKNNFPFFKKILFGIWYKNKSFYLCGDFLRRIKIL